MLDPNYVAFRHARALSGAAYPIHQHDFVPETAPTPALSMPVVEMHQSGGTVWGTAASIGHIVVAEVKGPKKLGLIFDDARERVNIVSISNTTYLYDALFRPEHSQRPTSPALCEIERPSTPQRWFIELTTPMPAVRARVVQKFNELTSEWRRTRNPTGSVLEICSTLAYQRIIAMGQDAVPLILRELERSVDHWFWALSAITGANPVLEQHRGRLKLMARDWLSWASDQGYQW